MEIKDYPGNSKSTTTKQKKDIKPVIEGGVEVKKKSEIAKMKDKVIQEDLPKVKNHIIFDIIIPKFKQILADSFNTLLFGESSGDRERSRRPAERVSYRRYYDEPRTRERPTTSTNRYSDYDDIIFDSRTEAFRVLETMKDIMKEYGEVSISDMYDLVSITCPHTYTRFGWVINTPSDLSDARVVPDGSGYVIKLPRPMQID